MPIDAVDPAILERRKSVRRAVSEVVRLELDNGIPGAHPGLLVTDISDGGVRVFAQNVEIPSRFALVFAESGIRRECRMVWRIGPEAGVEFVDQIAGGGKRPRREGRA
jgi:hypothetical protein